MTKYCLPPEILADALQDKINLSHGESRSAKSMKIDSSDYCIRCGKVNPADVHTCSPQKATSEQDARFAIDGAIEYGKLGINKPPHSEHWLMPYWEIGRQLAKAQQDKEDARRYRFLRECNSGSLCVLQITGISDEDQHILTESDADKAIDAAIAAQEKK